MKLYKNVFDNAVDLHIYYITLLDLTVSHLSKDRHGFYTVR